MLKTLINERIIMIDVDDTLVLHEFDKTLPGKYVRIPDPITPNAYIELRVHEPMVRLVKEEAARGSQLLIWSRGGFQWAENVARALEFDKLQGEILILTKPFAYFDDSDVSSWLKDRVYIGPDVPYKV